jgi:hypothetical protein
VSTNISSESDSIDIIFTLYAEALETRFPHNRGFILRDPGEPNEKLDGVAACFPEGLACVARASDADRVVALFESATCMVKIVVLKKTQIWLDLIAPTSGQADLFIRMIQRSVDASLW